MPRSFWALLTDIGRFVSSFDACYKCDYFFLIRRFNRSMMSKTCGRLLRNLWQILFTLPMQNLLKLPSKTLLSIMYMAVCFGVMTHSWQFLCAFQMPFPLRNWNTAVLNFFSNPSSLATITMPHARFWNVSTSLLSCQFFMSWEVGQSVFKPGWRVKTAMNSGTGVLLRWLVLISVKTEAVRRRKYFLCPTFWLFCRSFFWHHLSSAEKNLCFDLFTGLFICVRALLRSSYNISTN